MIIYFSDIRTILVLGFVCGVTCNPRPVEDASSKKIISSNNDANNLTGHSKANLRNAGNYSQQTTKDNRWIPRRQKDIKKLSSGTNYEGQSKDGTNNKTLTNKTNVRSKFEGFARKSQRKTREVTGNIEINDDGDVMGEIIIPDDSRSETDDVNLSNDNNNGVNNKDGIDGIQGSIELPDDPDNGIQGTIELPDDSDGDHEGIQGTIELPDDFNGGNDGIQGTIELPDDFDASHDSIQGTIELADDLDGNNGGIQGTIELPDDLDGHDGDIRGTIELPDDLDGDDGDIQGTIELPDDLDGNNDGIQGTIELPDDFDAGHDSIQGTIELPDDLDGNNDGIQGTIELPDDLNGHDGDIQGTIELPDDLDGDDGDIQGTIELPNDLDGNNDGIQGTIELPDDLDGHDGDIQGTIELPDDLDGDDGDIQGTIELPDDFNGGHDGNNDINQNSDDAIIGQISNDDDDNIEGTIEFPDDYFGGDDQNNNNIDEKRNTSPDNGYLSQDPDGKTCWMSLYSQKYLDALDKLDAKHKKARQEYQDDIGPAFDKQMMEVLLSSQGKAPRAIHQAQGDPSIIPAGLNLGGYGMMRMQGSLLFFHRLKLRNNTRFQVNYLQANLMHMSLFARLSLHDLHLQGAYERTNTEGDMNVLYFVPNYGELNVLLKEVAYKMEGRLRMLNNRLMIELISSEIAAKDVLLTYTNSTSSTKVLAQDNIDDFVDRLKSDLDLWLKDYFNDYLMYFGIVGGKNNDVQVYEKHKTYKVNEYADYVITVIKKRIRQLGFDNIVLPHLTIITATLQQVKLKSGKLRGFDSMYRRSVATTKKDDNVRKVDVIIGFSNLKVEYTYEAILGPSQPVVTGMLVLTADDLTAHLQLAQLDGSQTASINIDTIVQLKSEALTVEGPANRLIANFKYILENPILAIMTNVLKHNLRMLKTLPGCEPKLWGGKGRQWQLTPYKSRFNPDPKPAEKPTKTAEEVSKSYEESPDLGPDESTGGYGTKSTEDSGSPPFIVPDELPDRENTFIQSDDDNEWADYIFSKNDSVEIEAPVDGKVQKLKLERNENFILKKMP